MLLKLRAGEKLYINGAVIKVERKATIELLNDATFLLEAHVIQPDEASTPLRQLYFVLADAIDGAGRRVARPARCSKPCLPTPRGLWRRRGDRRACARARRSSKPTAPSRR